MYILSGSEESYSFVIQTFVELESTLIANLPIGSLKLSGTL